jgi:hypothetical protein
MSPTLWDLFFADFKPHPDPADVLIFGVVMAHLEHADDMAIIPYTVAELQRNLDTFAQWCSNNWLEVNADKSWIMIFGPIPGVPKRDRAV